MNGGFQRGGRVVSLKRVGDIDARAWNSKIEDFEDKVSIRM